MHTDEVAAEMVRRGHDVTVLTTTCADHLPPKERASGIEVVRVRAYPATRDYYVAPGAKSAIRDQELDLVHVQGYHTAFAPMVLRWLRKYNKPHLLTFHSGGPKTRFRAAIRPAQHRVLRSGVAASAALVAVSKFEQRMFAKVFDLPESAIDVIRNGISDGVLAASAGFRYAPGLIVSPGRLERYKGHHRAIMAMPRVLLERQDAHLLVVGSGGYESELRQLVSRLGLESSVSFQTIEPDKREEMGALLAKTSVGIFLSNYEAEGIGAVESRAIARRTIVADATALRELIDNDRVAGLSLEATTHEVADAIITALNSEGDDDTASRAPARSWRDVADDLEELYGRVLHA